MATLDVHEQSLSSINISDLSDEQIRRLLTQKFNVSCGPVNNSTRKVYLKKLGRLVNKADSFQDSASATNDDSEKEKENFINFSPLKDNRNLSDTFEQSFEKPEDNQEHTLETSPPQVRTYSPLKKLELPARAKERKSVRIDDTVTDINASFELSQHEENDFSLPSGSAFFPPSVSDNEYFKRPHCRPPIRRSTDSQMAYELDDSKQHRSRAISPLSALFSLRYFPIVGAVAAAFLVAVYMYLF